MDNETFPITPSPELVEEWANASARTHRENGTYAQYEFALATQAARWGADQELEACCEWFRAQGYHPVVHQDLRSERRPKPPSLKEQAQSELERLIALIPTEGALAMAEPIRRALESLPS